MCARSRTPRPRGAPSLVSDCHRIAPYFLAPPPPPCPIVYTNRRLQTQGQHGRVTSPRWLSKLDLIIHLIRKEQEWKSLALDRTPRDKTPPETRIANTKPELRQLSSQEKAGQQRPPRLSRLATKTRLARTAARRRRRPKGTQRAAFITGDSPTFKASTIAQDPRTMNHEPTHTREKPTQDAERLRKARNQDYEADPKSIFRTVSAYSVGTATEHLCDIKDVRVNKARNIVAIDTTSSKTKIALLEMTSLCGITVAAQLSSKEPNKITGVARGIDIPRHCRRISPPYQVLEGDR
ncbi:hypothetical protein HPB48_008814 [Haemaphysalis longicornis]|uniref:Uncharacterized protein n=1 Tax=Haemaphysalis longicornis TaxID=44386 RepID=A0A9J6H0I2_HAELO|nr:hypothetical protein HPB48_008814 [Haemaphysalis longicornis]